MIFFVKFCFVSDKLLTTTIWWFSWFTLNFNFWSYFLQDFWTSFYLNFLIVDSIIVCLYLITLCIWITKLLSLLTSKGLHMKSLTKNTENLLKFEKIHKYFLSQVLMVQHCNWAFTLFVWKFYSRDILFSNIFK